MMKSKVHAGPVQQLQFDATKVRQGASTTLTKQELPEQPDLVRYEAADHNSC